MSAKLVATYPTLRDTIGSGFVSEKVCRLGCSLPLLTVNSFMMRSQEIEFDFTPVHCFLDERPLLHTFCI